MSGPHSPARPRWSQRTLLLAGVLTAFAPGSGLAAKRAQPLSETPSAVSVITSSEIRASNLFDVRHTIAASTEFSIDQIEQAGRTATFTVTLMPSALR